jgi:hypothetical protein
VPCHRYVGSSTPQATRNWTIRASLRQTTAFAVAASTAATHSSWIAARSPTVSRPPAHGTRGASAVAVSPGVGLVAGAVAVGRAAAGSAGAATPPHPTNPRSAIVPKIDHRLVMLTRRGLARSPLDQEAGRWIGLRRLRRGMAR